MWPWSAAVFGYLCYTLYSHLRYREPPDGWAVLLVAFAAVVPDLIDKPLNWQFGVFANGYALGHSIFLGVPLAAASYLLARHWGAPRFGTAFGIGVLSHDVGDALEHMLDGNVWFGVKHMLWPMYTLPAAPSEGFSATTLHFLATYLHDILTLHLTPYLLLVSSIALLVLPIWLYDGCPGLREFWVGLTYPFSGRGR